jgi:hypothetical protein
MLGAKGARCVLVALLIGTALAACGQDDLARAPAAGATAAGSPSGALAPTDVLVQYDFEPTFFRPEAYYPFGRVPPFTLLADGRVIYVDAGQPPKSDKERAMEVRLSREEASRLVDDVLELGFGRLRSHLDSCANPGGTGGCVADSSFTILRVREPGGTLREVKIYDDFGPDPGALRAIRRLLSEYRHPAAKPYAPRSASLFIQPLSGRAEADPLRWPLGGAVLAPPRPGLDQWARVLRGKDLAALLRVHPRNMGDAVYRHGGKLYGIYVVPWLPGADHTAGVRGYGVKASPEEPPGASEPATPTAAPKVASGATPTR